MTKSTSTGALFDIINDQIHEILLNSKMAQKLCLQWNDFQDTIKNAFGHLRDTTDFVNVTLVTLIKNETTDDSNKIGGNALALPIRLKTSIMSTNLQELEETVKAMVEASENLIQEGKWQKRAKICKACGKEGPSTNIKQHIEANHLEGLSLPCNLCDKIFRSRKVLGNHISRNHKEY